MKNKDTYRNVHKEADTDKFWTVQFSLTSPKLHYALLLGTCLIHWGICLRVPSPRFYPLNKILIRFNYSLILIYLRYTLRPWFSVQPLAAFSAQLVDKSTTFRNPKSIYMIFKKIMHTHWIIPSCRLFIGCDHTPLKWEKITTAHTWLTLISKHLQINY